jgi:aryl-alcohol dehydrogenase-like predicted oxidoreductase
VEKRALGRTGQMSSLLILGGFALSNVKQKEADAGIELALQAGINQVDVSPLYGEAEARLGSWIKRDGADFFLGCKTAERSKAGAWEGLKSSLDRLKADHFDLFQLHMVDNEKELATALGADGALEAILEARQQGLVRFVGITGHHPPLHNQALASFDFDTVMFPLNRIHAAHFRGWNDWRKLLKTCQEKGVGVLAIKMAAKRNWEKRGEGQHPFNTWYEPFSQDEDLRKGCRYTLSQAITGAVLPGDLALWPALIKAAQEFRPLSLKEQRGLVSEVAVFEPLFAPFME